MALSRYMVSVIMSAAARWFSPRDVTPGWTGYSRARDLDSLKGDRDASSRSSRSLIWMGEGSC